MDKWTVQDRWGNEIYLTEERWQYILERHEELAGLLNEMLETLPNPLREAVIKMITTPPVSHFLKVMVYHSKTEQPPIPISYIEQSVALPLAA